MHDSEKKDRVKNIGAYKHRTTKDHTFGKWARSFDGNGS